LAAGKAALVLSASDGADHGWEKIARAARSGARGPVALCRLLASADLSLALGRSNVVHACVAEGRAAASLEAAIGRLDRYVNGGAGTVRAA
jgi:hypothetical protein